MLTCKALTSNDKVLSTTIKINHNHYVCFPKKATLSGLDRLKIISCYQCCVGEAGFSKEECEKEGITNWKRGKDCGCF